MSDAESTTISVNNQRTIRGLRRARIRELSFAAQSTLPPSAGHKYGEHQPAVRDALSLVPSYTAQKQNHVFVHIRSVLSFPFSSANVSLKPGSVISSLFQYARSGHVASLFYRSSAPAPYSSVL